MPPNSRQVDGQHQHGERNSAPSRGATSEELATAAGADDLKLTEPKLLPQRAIELDPNFAMGYRAAGTDYANLGELGRASDYYTKAFQLREHASEREKLMITADYYWNVTGELDKAAQTFQEEIESYPRFLGAHINLGSVYATLGQYERAAESYRQGASASPRTTSPLTQVFATA
jgi:tetratricopeptide (TPR) repeat protein